MERPYKLRRPADLESYIIGIVADETYLIFDRKRDVCRCSRCGTVRKISEMSDGAYLQHNEKQYCYDCGITAIAKEARYGRKGITEYGRILWFRKYGRVTYAQLDEYQINYTDWEPKVTFWASAQYRFCKESQDYYKCIPAGWWNPERWEKRKNVKLPLPASGMWNAWKMPTYFKTVTHPSWTTARGTDLKYANLDMQRLGFKEPDDPYGLIGYIYNFLKYPSIEILEKAGFKRLVGERTRGAKCRYINWRAKDLRKILKLNNKEIREFKAAGPGIALLERYREVRAAGINMRLDQLRYVPAYGAKNTIDRVKKFLPVEKAIKNLERQERQYLDLSIYADYLEECNKLGCDMLDKRILQPKDLAKAHEESSEKVKIEADKKLTEKFMASQNKLYTGGQYQDGSLLIRLAASPEELHKESQALCHCVRTYTDRVARGACAILFIRQVKDPDVPFYTLELSSKGDIVQCRGNHNCAMTGEVKAFVEKWHKEVVLKKKKKGAAAPAA